MLQKPKVFLRQWIINPIIHYIIRIISKSSYQLYPNYPSKISTTILNDQSSEIFFGYHDKTPFSIENDIVLAMRAPVRGNDPMAECRPVELGYFPLNKARRGNDFIKFSTTNTWCWQQSCMMQWDPQEPNSRIYYNDLVDGKYGSYLYDLQENKIAKSFNNPIYSISSNGKLAVSLNFSRLGRLRPGYGYSLLPDSTLNDPTPKDDGIFIVDFETGTSKLIVRLYDLAIQVSCDPGDEHYINHASFSPDGLHIVFFHIWKLFNSNKRKIRFCNYSLKTESFNIIEDIRTTSHYCWRDDNMILATNVDKSATWRYTLYDFGNSAKKDLDIALKQDGHPMFSPVDKEIFITDTYPDKRGDQHLCLVDLKNNKTYEVATLYSPLRFRGQVRCDLHPRWDRKGKQICVDTTARGKREMRIFEV